MRHAVYERARSALIEQLRSLEPPLSEAEIDRECRDLDEAITRVEADHNPVLGRKPPHATATRQAAGDLAGPGSRRALRSAARRPGRDASAARGRRGRGPRGLLAEPAPPYEEPAGPTRPRVDSRSPVVHSPGRARAFRSILALVIGAIAVFAWFLRDTPQEIAQQTPPSPAAPAPPAGWSQDQRAGRRRAAPASPQAPAQPAQQASPRPPPRRGPTSSVLSARCSTRRMPRIPQQPKA